MLYLRHTPGPPLNEFVEYLWYLADAPSHATERILPGGTAELVINLHDEIRVSPAAQPDRCRRSAGIVVSGPYSRPFDIDSTQHAAVMGVHFRPGGTFPVLGAPASELLNSHVNLEDLWGPSASAWRSRACAAASSDEQFAIAEETLTARLSRQPKRHRAVAAAVRALAAEAPAPPVAAIAERVGLSHRRLIEVFSLEVGMPPKLFSRVQRFRHALECARRTASPNWSRLAHACGYCDQSHLIRDFLAFSAMGPADYLRQRGGLVKDGHVSLGE